jgi:hypothetical protein
MTFQLITEVTDESQVAMEVDFPSTDLALLGPHGVLSDQTNQILLYFSVVFLDDLSGIFSSPKFRCSSVHLFDDGLSACPRIEAFVLHSRPLPFFKSVGRGHRCSLTAPVVSSRSPDLVWLRGSWQSLPGSIPAFPR